MKPDVRACADVNELSRRAAEAVVRTINDIARATGRCSLVLSGGHTPRTLYGLLASEFRDQIPWARVHVFWGDERYALTRAANIYILVAGSNKANALHHVLTGLPDPKTYPAAGVRLTEGTLIWWVDREAASSLGVRVMTD